MRRRGQYAALTGHRAASMKTSVCEWPARWLAACLLACLCEWAVADDGEPGFANFAQLASISVGGVAASYPLGDLSDDPLHVVVPTVHVGHCAAQQITVQGWQPMAYQHIVRALGQTLVLDQQHPSGTLDAPLAFGGNTVELTVERFVSLGQTARATYTLNIEREGPGTNAGLAALALSAGTLSPPFDPAIGSYSATVDGPTVALAPTAADCPQITVNGQPVASGGAAQVPLALGPNVVTVQSTAQDGSTRSYTLTLTRTASANADLQGLALSAGTLAPAFDPAVASYTATVPYAPGAVSVTPSLAVSTATLTINGAAAAADVPTPVALQVGANPIAVRVLAENGTATRAYTVDVTRALPDTTARLAALALSEGTLAPAFDPGVALYTASVGSAVSAVTVTPVPGFLGTAAVNGTPAGGGVQVPLAPGLNTIAVQATAQDGTTQFTYTLRVLRALSVQSARLAGLQLSSGTPWPPVHPAITAYGARVASGTASVILTPTAEDATATVRIDGGAPVAAGDASAPLPLAPGRNTFALQITSADGQLSASYTLGVLRGQGDAALAGLSLSDGTLAPAFDPAVTAYSASVPYVMASVRVGVALADADATVRVAGRVLRGGHAAAVALAPGLNTVPVQVTSSDGTAQRGYVLAITRAAQAQPLGDHPAQLAAPQALPLAGGTVRALAARDMDGDGLPDLLALDDARPDLALLPGQDGGGFGAAQWLPLGVVLPTALAPGDVMNQGWTDVLVTGSTQARLALNLGGGPSAQWLAHPATVEGRYENPVAHDVDGDGRQDMLAVSGNDAVVLRSLGDGGFAPAQVAGSLPSLRFVAVGDFDGDGRADLLLVSAQGALRVLPGLPQGGFGPPWDGSLGVAGISNMAAPPRVADLDGDGRDDLAMALSVNGLSTLAVLRGQPGGRRRGQLHARPGAVRRQRCLHRHACHGLPVHGLDGRLRGPGRRLHPGQCPGGAGFGGAVRAPCLRRHGHSQPGGGRHGELRTQLGGAWRQRYLYRHGQHGLPVRGLDGGLHGPGRPLHPGRRDGRKGFGRPVRAADNAGPARRAAGAKAPGAGAAGGRWLAGGGRWHADRRQRGCRAACGRDAAAWRGAPASGAGHAGQPGHGGADLSAGLAAGRGLLQVRQDGGRPAAALVPLPRRGHQRQHRDADLAGWRGGR